MEKIPYSKAIGSIMYLMVSTRPDIAYAISCLSRFMSNPGTTHWEALKWLFRYLNGSNNSGIKFSKCSEGVKLMGYVDSNYANNRDSRRSTTSYVFTLCGACISWKSQLQNIVALSTTEAEYIAITEAFKEALWLEGFVTLGPRSSFGYDDHLRSATFGFGPRFSAVVSEQGVSLALGISLSRYKLDLSKNIDENIDDFTKLIQDIKLTGDKNIDDYSPIVLLNAIPETYGDVKAAIKYGRDNVNLETVVSGLKSKEMEKTNKPSQNQNEVNFVRGRTKNRNSDYKYRRHSKSRSRSRGRSNSRNKYRNDKNNNERNNEEKSKEKRCYNCGGRGHFIKDCRKPKKNDSKDTANVADSHEVYMICDVNSISSSLKINEWLIDSGCTYHMTPFREILTNYKSEKLGSVSMANEKYVMFMAMVMCVLIFENGFKLTLKNVRHVPDLAHNLISCSALEEEGLEGKWGKGVMEIMRDLLLFLKAERKRNLYICSVKYECHTASVSKTTTSDLWHKRLGHISMKGLDFLHKNGILKEKPVEFDFCDECVLGKQHNVHFPSPPSPKPTSFVCILDYVHADVWGPSNIETHGGNRYFLSVIDNFSIKVFVFLMKHKSEAFEKFRNWKTLVENQTGQKLKALRTDNGSPSVPLSGKIPECIWTDSDVNISSLRIFGCSAFALSHGDKLDPRSQKCVFIGYPDGVKGYRLWLRSQLEDYNIESKVEEPIEDNQQGEENRVETETENENLETSDNLNHYLLARDRERRQPRIPAKLRDFQLALNTKNLEEPTSYNEALKTPESEKCVKLMGYVDSNYANNRDSRRSTTSYVFTLCGACISWKSQLQNIVALSTTEAEYIAITEAFKEALWLEGFVTLGPRSSFGYDDHLRSATFGFGPRWRLLKCWPKSTNGPTTSTLLDG
ncbi:UNVERIFIED_CONTAM: Retrovirus-related Pol polyprotein from transposon TNT 1-94 [Sesamum calycinum]|uniref:Retrovirus-related Pol polyprotein from transposon TNT 1-94 n=1 Tax=Sesamum calycinum TaxID=2727403 RepID=A0AAW2LRK5_9LAMI